MTKEIDKKDRRLIYLSMSNNRSVTYFFIHRAYNQLIIYESLYRKCLKLSFEESFRFCMKHMFFIVIFFEKF